MLIRFNIKPPVALAATLPLTWEQNEAKFIKF